MGGQAQQHLVSIRRMMNVMYDPFDGHCIIHICDVTWFSFRLAVETKQLTPCLPFPVDRVESGMMQTAAASSDPRSPPLSLSSLPSVSSMSSIWNGVPSIEPATSAATTATGGTANGFQIRRPLVQSNMSAHASPLLHPSPTVASPASPKSNGGHARPPLSRIVTDVTVKPGVGAIGDDRRPKVSILPPRTFLGSRTRLWGLPRDRGR